MIIIPKFRFVCGIFFTLSLKESAGKTLYFVFQKDRMARNCKFQLCTVTTLLTMIGEMILTVFVVGKV